MATSTFNDTNNDGNLATAGNWSGSALPAAGNDVVIDRSGNDLFGSIAGNNVLTAKVTAGWTGTQFGTTSTDVTIQCNGSGRYVDLYFGGRFISGRLATATSAMTLLRLKSLGLGALTLTSGTFTDVRGNENGGTGYVGASAIVTGIRTNAMSWYAFAGTAFTTANVGAGGILKTERDITTGYNYSRLLTLKTAAGTTLYNGPGSVFNPRGSGAMTTVELVAAALSLEEAVSNVAITTLTYDQKSSIQRVGKGVTLTVTNDDGY